MDALPGILLALVVIFVIVFTCAGYLIWPIVIVTTVVMLLRQKGWAEAGQVYAACGGSFLGAAGVFIVWAQGVGSLEGPVGAVIFLLFANPLTAGATLGSILGITVWASVVRIAEWRERRVGDDPQ